MTRKLRKELFKLMDMYNNLKVSDLSFSDGHVDNLNESDIAKMLKDIDFNEDSEFGK